MSKLEKNVNIKKKKLKLNLKCIDAEAFVCISVYVCMYISTFSYFSYHICFLQKKTFYLIFFNKTIITFNTFCVVFVVCTLLIYIHTYYIYISKCM